MNKETNHTLYLPELDKAGKESIFQALQLLIEIFWSGDGRKQWEELWHRSTPVWSSLQGVVFAAPSGIVTYQDKIRAQGRENQVLQDLESIFVNTFINTYGGVSAPLYHSCYHGEEQHLMQQPALEMQARLEDAGLEPQNAGEPLDHLCIELEYLYFLISLHLQQPDTEIAGEAADFSGNFMLPWVNAFVESIPADQEQTAFFANTARAMRDLLDMLGRTSRKSFDE